MCLSMCLFQEYDLETGERLSFHHWRRVNQPRMCMDHPTGAANAAPRSEEKLDAIFHEISHPIPRAGGSFTSPALARNSTVIRQTGRHGETWRAGTWGRRTNVSTWTIDDRCLTQPMVSMTSLPLAEQSIWGSSGVFPAVFLVRVPNGAPSSHPLTELETQNTTAKGDFWLCF